MCFLLFIVFFTVQVVLVLTLQAILSVISCRFPRLSYIYWLMKKISSRQGSILINFWRYPSADLKSPYIFVFIQKQYLANFAFLILRIIKLFTREVCKFLKNKANFQYILSFRNVCKQTFHISHVRISQKVKGVTMTNLRHIIFMWRRRYQEISKSALGSSLFYDTQSTRHKQDESYTSDTSVIRGIPVHLECNAISREV